MYGEIEVEHWSTASNDAVREKITKALRSNHNSKLPGIGVLGKEPMSSRLGDLRIYAGYWGEVQLDVIHLGPKRSKIVLTVTGDGRNAINDVWRTLRPVWRWRSPRLIAAWVKEESSDKAIVEGASRLKADVLTAESARLFLIALVGTGAAWFSSTLTWVSAAPAIAALVVTVATGVSRRMKGVIKWN